MPPKDRKRSSAFEDFPVEPGPAEETGVQQPTVLKKARADALPQVERIERLPPSQMIPDRFQPRRLLPATIRAAFFSGEIDCYQAAGEWLALGKQDAAVRQEIERLLNMGNSFEAHGQIKPITGAWVSATNGSYLFQIETGERRFWAACLQAVTQKAEQEPLLRVEVINQPTRQRQVLENRHAEAPSAVEQACEVAALILAEIGIEPDAAQADEYEYFRLARAQRMPAGLWEKIMPVMQLTRPRMVQLLNILQLPSPILEIADRYRIPERVLREILGMPRDQWERMVRVSAQNQLTSDEVAEMAQAETLTPPAAGEKHAPQPLPEPSRQAIRYLRRFANVLDSLDEVSRSQAIDEIANDLVVSRSGQSMWNLLDDLGRSLNARLTRMKR